MGQQIAKNARDGYVPLMISGWFKETDKAYGTDFTNSLGNFYIPKSVTEDYSYTHIFGKEFSFLQVKDWYYEKNKEKLEKFKL